MVLPSPNGSTIAASAGNSRIAAGSLLNASAVGHWLACHGYGTAERPVALIASGERWADGGLRPALEDLLGAGAIATVLREQVGDTLSPEATAAAIAFQATPDVKAAVTACSSGRELIAGGFAQDVAIASELNLCTTVPLLVDGAFTAAG
ncbi:2-phosphosulfolactate phosphatase [Streptomyces ovatisporus]|uniref:Probable 2-phosphosulfolactate phosphatase n=1 Tax=Streptomyces ovatisporus TaxID=1128682 RepID=A0ABV9ABK4_9ACTN